MSDLHYASVVEHLLHRIPELREEYDKTLEWWRPDAPGPYIIYGDHFVDYIVELSQQIGDADKYAALVRAMRLFEELAGHDDFDLRCLAEVGVIEQLFGTKGRMERLAPHMGPATRALAIEYGERMGFQPDWIERLTPAEWVR
jgi:hypothetical protein